MMHRGGGGRGAGGRGAGRRRMRCSLAGTRGAEEAWAPVGEAMGRGGRGAHRWWGGVRRSRKRHLPVGEVWGPMSSGMRSGDAGLGGVGSGVAGSGG
jgi:hypothetical protein